MPRPCGPGARACLLAAERHPEDGGDDHDHRSHDRVERAPRPHRALADLALLVGEDVGLLTGVLCGGAGLGEGLLELPGRLGVGVDVLGLVDERLGGVDAALRPLLGGALVLDAALELGELVGKLALGVVGLLA